MSVCECLFDNEGVGGVVVERIAESCGFGGFLFGMVVAAGLDDTAQFAEGLGEARVRFLDVHGGEFFAEGGFREAQTWIGCVRIMKFWSQSLNIPLLALTIRSIF